eukprot:TRINITY_DN1527_c0_g1_i4.p1 TRINITY_DN1527_c0_g1~~TRINITY_DN1527_c0_g1_i4.p1  ORF type:complete len:391 (-),score=15.87 TRINITY_DN1527_c0_g1_i4:111-1229(-)
MSSLLFLLTLLLLFFFHSSAAKHHHQPPKPPQFNPNQKQLPVSPEIHQACKATRYPETCETALSPPQTSLPNHPKPIDIIQTAISISTQNLKTAQTMAKTILDSSSTNQNRSNAAKNCLEVLGYSQYRLSSSSDVLPRGRTKDTRAWMSAALLYQYDCFSALKYVNDSQRVNETMAFLMALMGLTSNALSMVVSYDLYGDETGLWKPPLTERSGFWGGVSGGGAGSGFRGGFPSDLTADVTVCKVGDGCYRTVQEAVDAAPVNGDGRRFVIYIKEGVYKETVRVPLERRNVVFLGDGMGKTVITGSMNVGLVGVTTYNTATVGKDGDDDMILFCEEVLVARPFLLRPNLEKSKKPLTPLTALNHTIDIVFSF